MFWKSVQRALSEAGVEVWVANARHVKRAPGRKTDVSDSQWLAMLARYGLVCPSFVAPPRLEELRRLTRLHARTRRMASTLRNMLHRMLDESGLRIGGILTDLFGLSGRNLLDGLVAGQAPEQMVAGVKGNARKKIPALLDALGYGLDDGAKPLVALLRDMQEAVERSLADLERRIVEAAEQDYELPWTLLQTLPGTGPLAAAALLAEVGDDMEAFGTARRLASWGGICPGNHESAGKSKGGKRRKGNVYLRRILCEVAHAAARTHGVQFGPYKQQLAKRRGAGRAVVATAHKILRIVFAMLRDGKPYCDPQIDYQARMAVKNKARWLKMLRKANLLEDVAKKAADQLRAAPDPGCRRPTATRGRTRTGAGLSQDGRSAYGRQRERRGKHAHRGEPTPVTGPHTGTASPTKRRHRAGRGEVCPCPVGLSEENAATMFRGTPERTHRGAPGAGIRSGWRLVNSPAGALSSALSPRKPHRRGSVRERKRL